jgi:hypothetical protein
MKQMAKRNSESQWWQQFKNIEYNRKGKSKSFVLVKIADTCPPLDKLSVSIQQQKKAWIMSPIALVSFKNIEKCHCWWAPSCLMDDISGGQLHMCHSNFINPGSAITKPLVPYVPSSCKTNRIYVIHVIFYVRFF